MGPQRRPRVVVLGGGIGGRSVAAGLARAAGAGRVETIVIDSRPAWVDPTRLAAAAQPAGPRLRAESPRVSYPHAALVTGRVMEVDTEGRRVFYAPGGDAGCGVRTHITYDHLVVCLGGRAEDRRVRGVREHAVAFRTPGDAAVVRAAAADARRVVVVGASPAGIALAGTMAASLHDSHVTLVDTKRRLLPTFPDGGSDGETIGERVGELLTAAGATLSLETQVTEIEADRVLTRDAGPIRADLVVWTAGLRAPTVVESRIGGEHSTGGRLVVDPHLAVRGVPNVWACGDCADVPELEFGGACVQTASYAVRAGRRIARNVLATLDGDYPRAFRRTSPDDLVVTGPHSAVGRVFGRPLRGPAGYVALRVLLAPHTVRAPASPVLARRVPAEPGGAYDAHVVLETARETETPVRLTRKR